MELLIALLAGVLYASGTYLILRRSMVKLIIGLTLLANGVNLLIFMMGRLVKGAPPIIPENAKILEGPFDDPIPQALILTAIVISFGLQSFAIILLKRTYQVVKTDDLDAINTTDEFA